MHKSPGVAIPSKTTVFSAGQTSSCGCRCGGCTCSSCSSHHHISMLDSNQEAYGGQGTGVDALSADLSNLNTSSFEAHDPKNVIVAPPSLELLTKLNGHISSAQRAETRTQQYVDDIDNAPFRHFISERSMTNDATETSGLFFGPMELEGSMENNPADNGGRSMLASYSSAMSVRSDAASALVQYAGAALAASRPSLENQRNPYLQLL